MLADDIEQLQLGSVKSKELCAEPVPRAHTQGETPKSRQR